MIYCNSADPTKWMARVFISVHDETKRTFLVVLLPYFAGRYQAAG